jgi:hypothetical protein
MRTLLLLLLLPISAFALPKYEKGDFSLEVSGNIEGQARKLWNPTSAKRFPQLQDWEES